MRRLAVAAAALLVFSHGTVAQSWQTAAAPSLTADVGSGWGCCTARLVVPASAIPPSAFGGTQVRITLQAANGNALVFSAAYSGQGAGAGSYAYASTPVAETLGGSASGSVAAGTQTLLDAATFSLPSGGDFVASFDLVGSGLNNLLRCTGGSGSPLTMYYKVGHDAATQTASGYSQSGCVGIVAKVEFFTSGSPPPPPIVASTITTQSAIGLPLTPATSSNLLGGAPIGALPALDNGAQVAGSSYQAIWQEFSSRHDFVQGALATMGHDALIGDSITESCPPQSFSPFAYSYAIGGDTVAGGMWRIFGQQAGGYGTGYTSLSSAHALYLELGRNTLAISCSVSTTVAQLEQLLNATSGPLVWPGLFPDAGSVGGVTIADHCGNAMNPQIAQVNQQIDAFLANRPHTHNIGSALRAVLAPSGVLLSQYANPTDGVHPTSAWCAAQTPIVLQGLYGAPF